MKRQRARMMSMAKRKGILLNETAGLWYKNHCCLLNYTITSVKITLPMPEDWEGEQEEKGFISGLKNELSVNAPRFFISTRSHLIECSPFKDEKSRGNMLKFLPSFYHIINSKQVRNVCSRKLHETSLGKSTWRSSTPFIYVFLLLLLCRCCFSMINRSNKRNCH